MKRLLFLILCLVAGIIYFRKEIYVHARREADIRFFLPEIRQAAEANSLSPRFVMSMVYVESKFKPRAVSPSGAQGLMQVMPATAKQIAAKKKIRDTDLFDPKTNLTIGTLYVRQLVGEFEDTHLALAAYNGGPGAVKEWIEANKGDTNIDHFGKKETREYVKSVNQAHERLEILHSYWQKVKPYVE